MEKEIIGILADYACVSPDKVSGTSTLRDDLKLNSLDVINIVVEFEERFGIEIPDVDIRGFQTIDDVVDYIRDHTVGGAVQARV